MQRRHSLIHKKWEIYAAGRENNPPDWQPGHPMRYAVRGWAEYRGDHESTRGWIDVNRIDWNEGFEQNVDDNTKWQDNVLRDLIAEIDRKQTVPA